MCHLHFCKRAVCACRTCEFYGTLLQTGISPYFAYGIAANLGKKGSKNQLLDRLVALKCLVYRQQYSGSMEYAFF